MGRILILLEHKQNRRLLKEALASKYEIISPGGSVAAMQNALMHDDFDLAIVDGLSLRHYERLIQQRKEAEGAVFLPFLFVTSHRDVRLITRHLWRTVDEIIRAPIEQVELHARVEIMLRARRLSVESEQRYYALASQSPVGVAIVQDGQVVYGNDTYARIMEIAPDEIPSTDFMERIHPDDQRDLGSNGVVQANDQQQGPQEFRLFIPGRMRWIEMRQTPLRYHGKPAMLCIIADISVRKEAEERLIEAKRQAEEVARMKSTLLDNMSHEIRTPLTAIIGFSGLLKQGKKVDREEIAGYINISAKRLLETLNSVIDLAQLEGGSLKLRPTRVDLVRQVRETISLYSHQAQERGLQLTLVEPEVPIETTLDQGALNRVLTNLVSNALKFTEAGGVTVFIEPRGMQVEIRVEDTGVGISKSFLPHLFEAFKQESEGLARDYEGNGLGLTITKRLVELMGGWIEVESEKGRGSTFRVILPYQPSQRKSSSALRKASPPGIPERAAMPANDTRVPEQARRPRLLVVEDNAMTRELVVQLLADAFTVEAVANGPSALARAAHASYDVVLLDINLGPSMSGEEVLQALRALPGYAETPVLAVTAHALPGDRDRFLQHGFDGYLSKPFTSEQLFQALDLVPELKPKPAKEGNESLEELLNVCLDRGLIDHYELDEKALVLVRDIAHFRLTRHRAPIALRAMLEDA